MAKLSVLGGVRAIQENGMVMCDSVLVNYGSAVLFMWHEGSVPFGPIIQMVIMTLCPNFWGVS